VADANHDSSVVITKEIMTQSAPVVGYAQGYTASVKEVEFTIPMTEDLGDFGSLSLVADVSGLPTGYMGVHPLLVSFHDGVNEWVNLPRNGTSGDCAQNGFFSGCTKVGECVATAGCQMGWPSAYISRDHWDQHQLGTFGFENVNTFPTCNWAGGDNPPASNSTSPACAFNSVPFLASGKMRSGAGVEYKARYLLLSTEPKYSTVSNGTTGTLTVTVIKKKDLTAAVGGAVDINVFLVGDSNVVASRTERGKQNLDMLFSAVGAYFSQPLPAGGTPVNVKLGKVTAYEWGCETTDGGGDVYENLDLNNYGTMLQVGSQRADAASEGKALNIFIVSTILYPESNLTILGLAGAIGGPMVHGKPTSGLVFGSHGMLDTFNASCSASPCPLAERDDDFIEMGTTIAHEMGHFLGLNHPSERYGTSHDLLLDTPICTKTAASPTNYLTIGSCLEDTNVFGPTGYKCHAASSCATYDSASGTYCPNALECQFNYMMWWSTKNVKNGTTDGNHFSVESGTVINYSPFIQ